MGRWVVGLWLDGSMGKCVTGRYSWALIASGLIALIFDWSTSSSPPDWALKKQLSVHHDRRLFISKFSFLLFFQSRFNSLSLAFKTDRLTLEKRLGIQERSRDIAEQNIDKELQGLRDAADVRIGSLLQNALKSVHTCN